VKGAKDVGVEFTTMSKPYNMAGFRIGFVAGNREMIDHLATIKGYYDYGIFQAIQIAGIIAMRHCDADIAAQNEKYRSRRDVVCSGLDRIGWQVEKPRATMFVWARVPGEHLGGKGTIDYAMDLMEYAEVAIAPGRAFGENGEGCMRIALVENEQRLRQAVRNIGRFVNRKPVRKDAPRQ
jgi:alanine-synthesizing transaminase